MYVSINVLIYFWFLFLVIEGTLPGLNQKLFIENDIIKPQYLFIFIRYYNYFDDRLNFHFMQVRQISGFLRVLRFPPQIKLTAMI